MILKVLNRIGSRNRQTIYSLPRLFGFIDIVLKLKAQFPQFINRAFCFNKQ